MLTVAPKMETRQLVGAQDVGRLAHLNGRFAIVTVAPQDPAKRFSIASFDTSTNSFVHSMYRGDDALCFGDEFLFEPDLTKPIGQSAPGIKSGGTAFLDKDGVYVVVTIPTPGGGTDFRLVNLRSGAIVAWHGQPMYAFPNWRLVVPRSDGSLAQVFRV